MYRLSEMSNLWVAHNAKADITILICSDSQDRAQQMADVYREDLVLPGEFEVSPLTDATQCFDCNYVLA